MVEPGTDRSRTVPVHDLLFGVRRSVRYHNRRRLYFDRISNWIRFVTVVSGFGVVTSLVGKFGDTFSLFLAAVVAGASAFDLVVGAGQKARLHTDLAGEFLGLEREIIIAGEEVAEKKCARLVARRLEIEAKEPPPMRVLDTLCYNELIRAMGYDESYFAKVKWYQRLLCQFVDILPHRIKIPTPPSPTPVCR